MNTPTRHERQAEHVALALARARSHARQGAARPPAAATEPARLAAPAARAARAGALRLAVERALCARAGARLRVLAIPRNFDAGPAEPAPGPYHRFSARRYIKTMNDFSRAPRVLVVEDDEDIAQALQRSLRMEGYEVRAAADGQARSRTGAHSRPTW